MLEIEIVPALNDNYIYLIHDPVANETAVVDPAQAEPVLELLANKSWTLNYILNTHHHWDHVDGNRELKDKTGCTVIGSVYDKARIPAIDRSVDENSKLSLGDHAIQVIETPGHTLGHVVYYFAEDKALFCGDTLFSLGCGRLFEGSAEQLWQSLQKLKKLPPDTRIYCAHEYTEVNALFAQKVERDNAELLHFKNKVRDLRAQNLPSLPSLLADELACNPFLREHSRSIQQYVCGENTSALEVFSALRRLKDSF